MAFIPDEAALAMRNELTPAARDLFIYYCVRRNRKSGGFNCPLSRVLAELKGIKRAAYFGAKRELLDKDWIEARGDFITPVRGFKSPENQTSPKLKSPKIQTSSKSKSPEIQTDSPENQTTSPENQTSHNIEVPATIPATSIADSGVDVQSNQTKGVKRIAPEKPKTDHQLAMDFLWETVGPQKDAGGQAKAVKWMLENDFTLDEIKHYLPLHVSDYRKKNMRPTYLSLSKVIGEMRLRSPILKSTEADTEADDYEKAILEIQRYDDARFKKRKDEAMNGGH